MIKKIILPAFIFAVTAANAQQPTSTIVVVKGQKITVVDSLTMNIVQEAMGQTMEIPGNTYSNTVLEIKETSPAKTIIASTLKKTSVYFNVMGQETSYNSESPSDQASDVGKAFEDKLNKTLDVEIDNQGKMIRPETPEPAKKAKDEESGASMDMIKNLTGGSAGNAAENAFMILPVAAKKGASWIDSTVADGIKTMRTYIITGIENNFAVISVMGVISGSRKVEMQGMEMNMNLGGKVDGEIILNMATGLVKKRTTIVEPNNTLEVMGMSIPITGKVSSVSYFTAE